MKSNETAAHCVIEAARDVPVVREVDVLVCGAGPAGIGAALAAARSGAKTLLLERHPFLGGVWTAGALTIIIDCHNKGGINQEIRDRLAVEGAGVDYHRNTNWGVYTTEPMKHLLDEMMIEAGVEVQFYSTVVAAGKAAGDARRVDGVFVESKSGREFIRAKVVIDCSGDGDVAARAGCDYHKGRASDGKMQPMTLYARIGGFKGDFYNTPRRLLPIAQAAGWDPSYEKITLFEQPGQPGVYMLMATHLYGADGCDVRDLSTAETEARRELKAGVALLKKNAGPDWEDIYLLETGPFIGVREGRRILGRHYLTYEDLKSGAQFDDGVCNVQFNIDIHSCDPTESKGLHAEKVPPYQIPYRCLLAKDIDNLMMAGRCISGDHVAHSSYRVTGDAVAMGEAAGMGAALAVQAGVDPHAIDVGALQAKLAAFRGVGVGAAD